LETGVTAAPVFLEIIIPASDVLTSLQWYLQLGFQELPVGDTRDYNYAVVTDGRVCIGLHGNQMTSMGLSFVLPDVARYARELMANGVEPEYARIGIEEFHELVLHDPDGQAAALLEARTFSQRPTDELPEPAIGRLSHFSLACTNVDASLTFWQEYGFTGVTDAEQQHAELYGSNLKIELHEGTRRALLNFVPDEGAACLATLDSLSIAYRPLAGGIVLSAPEGTGLWIATGN